MRVVRGYLSLLPFDFWRNGVTNAVCTIGQLGESRPDGAPNLPVLENRHEEGRASPELRRNTKPGLAEEISCCVTA